MTAFGCASPLHPARTSPVQPVSERERVAEERYENRRCSPTLGLAFPGAGHYCLRQPATAAILAGLGASEIALSAWTASELGFNDNRTVLSFVALQNTYIVGIVDPILEQQRAQKGLYVPQDTLDELLLAPFNPEVLSRTDVWLGILVTAATQSLVLALDGSFAAARGRDVNVLGAQLRPALGYPAATLALGATFEHVAIGEEILFRGLIQSGLARRYGQLEGYLAGTAIFGAAHLPNAFLLDSPQDRREYLLFALPVITGVGAYFGASYVWNDYSLAAPVALHFWYDLLVGLSTMVADPDNGFVSARITVPW